MNFVIVRNKLHTVIALQLLRSGKLRRPFVFLPLYGSSEEAASLAALHSTLSRSAALTVRNLLAGGSLRGACVLALGLLVASCTGGRLYAATVDYYALALALKLIPFARFVGFDDGNANTQPTSRYYSDAAPSGLSPRMVIARLLFPRGSAAYCRERILQHYTIYPGRTNIVDTHRLISLAIDWSLLVSEADAAKLSSIPRTVMLGTVYDEIVGTHWWPNYRWALERCDAYLRHPREKSDCWLPGNAIVCDAPAESVIVYWASRCTHRLTILHFNSSVAASFSGDERFEFIDLLSERMSAAA